MKDLMLKNGTDLEQIRKYFFASGDNCTDSIKSSKAYIIAMCNSAKKSIWDLVRDEQVEIDNDKDYTDYQKMMTKASLLLAWEELERDNEEICFELQKFAHH